MPQMLSRSWLIPIFALVFGLHCALFCTRAQKPPRPAPALPQKTLISFNPAPENQSAANKAPQLQAPAPKVQKPLHAPAPLKKSAPASASAKAAQTAQDPSTAQISPNHHAAQDLSQEKLKNAYLAEIRELIKRHKNYPLVSKRLGEQGVVRLAFCVEASGAFCNMRVASSSTFARLDAAALGALTQARAHKPPPSRKRLELWLDVSFVITD